MEKITIGDNFATSTEVLVHKQKQHQNIQQIWESQDDSGVAQGYVCGGFLFNLVLEVNLNTRFGKEIKKESEKRKPDFEHLVNRWTLKLLSTEETISLIEQEKQLYAKELFEKINAIKSILQ